MRLEIKNLAGHLIRRLHQIATSVFQDRLVEAGYNMTSVQFAAMNTLRVNPSIDQRTLAGLIAYDRATIGGVIDRLEAKGYVERLVNEKDRRARTLNLTPAGDKALEIIIPIVVQLQDDILTGLDAAERTEFLRLAEKVTLAGNHLSRAPHIPLQTDD